MSREILVVSPKSIVVSPRSIVQSRESLVVSPKSIAESPRSNVQSPLSLSLPKVQSPTSKVISRKLCEVFYFYSSSDRLFLVVTNDSPTIVFKKVSSKILAMERSTSTIEKMYKDKTKQLLPRKFRQRFLRF